MNDPNNDFKKNYREIITKDGSKTLWSENFQEACHSLDGAKEETLYNFLFGCEIENKIKKALELKTKSLSILEVGFGAGVGVLSTMEFTKKVLEKFPRNERNSFKLVFHSLEIDEVLVQVFSNLKLEKKEPNIYQYTDSMFEIKIIIGDARKSVTHLFEQIYGQSMASYDAIFQDAFSPQKNPSLWTSEWFSDLKKISNDETILSTYCSATRVRKAMVEGGWLIENFKGFSKKRDATRCYLSPLKITNNKLMERIIQSQTPALRDHLINIKK